MPAAVAARAAVAADAVAAAARTVDFGAVADDQALVSRALGAGVLVVVDPADSARAVLLPLLRAARVLALHRPSATAGRGRFRMTHSKPNAAALLPARRAARRRAATAAARAARALRGDEEDAVS